MPYKNIVMLVGHATKDPELKYLDNGTGIIKFMLAVKRKYSKDKVDYINVEAFDRGKYKLAEWTAKKLKKGDLVIVDGELHIDNFKGKYYTKVRANNIDVISKQQKQDDEAPEPETEYQEDDDFDVPF